MRTLLILVALCACMLLPTSGEAHHNTKHKVLVVGEWTSVPFLVTACREIEAAEILTFANHKGSEAFDNLFTLLSVVTVEVDGIRSTACGTAKGHVLPMWIISRETIRERTFTVFRFRLGNGMNFVGVAWGPVITQTEYLLSTTE